MVVTIRYNRPCLFFLPIDVAGNNPLGVNVFVLLFMGKDANCFDAGDEFALVV